MADHAIAQVSAKPNGRHLKGLSHDIFTVIFWFEWIYLGLNENHY
jgi:hypothetical protein